MLEKNKITLFISNYPPCVYYLDSFNKNEVRLGRGPIHGNEGSPINDIVIDPSVAIISRAHCTFLKTEEGWFITDDGSYNGLSFNGARISGKQLHDGDQLTIGTRMGERCVIAFSVQRQSDVSSSVNVSSGANGGAFNRDMFSYNLTGKSRYVIGRAPDCDIVIGHPSVSRNHCVITNEGGVYYIYDNNSVNGVILNGSPLNKKQRLERMDKVTIADVTLVFDDGKMYFLTSAGGVSVAAHNIVKRVSSGRGKKLITDNVSLSIEPGEFVAIVGGSGAGKTTLLNCLSGMTDFTSGDVLINGVSIKANNRSVRSIIGYVPQNDIVYDSLTLERMLLHSAKLRMPKDTSRKEIDEKIKETLEMVELTEHRHTLISKLSGGQKKRASIAVELLASPKLFFLDEPSSGLDPGTEKNLMAMLKRLAESGKTVITVTHTVQNINMCDRIICMGNGGLLCYSGKPAGALSFFGKQNMTDIYDDLNDNSKAVSTRFTQQFGAPPQTTTGSITDEKEKKPGIFEGLRQFRVLTARYAEITVNSKMRLALLLLMPVVLTVLVCLAFQADGNIFNYLGVIIDRTILPFEVADDTMKLLFSFSCAAFWVGIFNSVQEISKERRIYEREQFTGVKPIPYIFSKFVVIGILCFIQSAIMVAMLIFFTNTTATVDGDINSVSALSIGMNEGGIVFGNALWLELFVTTFLSLLSAMCLGLAVSSAVSNEMALVICPVCLLPQILFSGVASPLSGLTEAISKVITCRWSCIAYFTSSNINSMLARCTYDSGMWVKIEFSNGYGIDEAYSEAKTYLFGLNPVYSSWIALAIMSVVCLLAAILFLYFRNVNIKSVFKKK